MNKLSKFKKNGFTLVELLVVVSVIAVLGGIVMSVINVPEKLRQSRDSLRVQHVLALQSALINSIANQNISLQSTIDCDECTSISQNNNAEGEGWVKFNKLTDPSLSQFIQALPIDPINEEDLYYVYASDGTYFEINARFESQQYQDLAQNDGGNNDTIYERGSNLSII